MPAPIAIQLHTLRDEAERDFASVIDRVARMGYVGVETAGLHGMPPAEFRRRVSDAGLVVCSAHGPLPLGDDGRRVLDEHAAIGSPCLIVPYLPMERFRSASAVEAVASDMNRAWENVRAYDMGFGYHNHWWEFQSRVDARSAYDLLLDSLAPEICAELDVYWARVGGADPADLVRRVGVRGRLLHIKDGPADGSGAPMVAVGSGALDVDAIVRGAQAEWHVVELDRYDGDMFEAVEQSLAYLVDHGLGIGRA
jgi:sugar phosphate isomerase/epimerase